MGKIGKIVLGMMWAIFALVSKASSQEAMIIIDSKEDSIQVNQVFMVDVTLVNVEEWKQYFENFSIIGRPLFNQSVVSENGKVKKMTKLSLALTSKEKGAFTLGPIVLNSIDGKPVESNKLTIMVTEDNGSIKLGPPANKTKKVRKKRNL